MKYFLITLIFLTGCATHFKPVCRHNALYAAIVAGEELPTRVAVGDYHLGGRHAQAQVFIDGQWHWLVSGGTVRVGQQDDFKPDGWVNTDNYFKSRFGR